MALRYYFTFEQDWRKAPLAFWVHRPDPASKTACLPPVPRPVLHRGYLFLHVEFAGIDLVFSAPPQLDHFIEVLSAKPMPTSRQLALKRGAPVGPNSHWLSRLPAKLKAPRERSRLVNVLRRIQFEIARSDPLGDWSAHSM